MKPILMSVVLLFNLLSCFDSLAVASASGQSKEIASNGLKFTEPGICFHASGQILRRIDANTYLIHASYWVKSQGYNLSEDTFVDASDVRAAQKKQGLHVDAFVFQGMKVVEYQASDGTIQKRNLPVLKYTEACEQELDKIAAQEKKRQFEKKEKAKQDYESKIKSHQKFIDSILNNPVVACPSGYKRKRLPREKLTYICEDKKPNDPRRFVDGITIVFGNNMEFVEYLIDIKDNTPTACTHYEKKGSKPETCIPYEATKYGL